MALLAVTVVVMMAFHVAAGHGVAALLSVCFLSTLTGASDFCLRDDEMGQCVPNMSFNLTRIDGKKVWDAFKNAKSDTALSVSLSSVLDLALLTMDARGVAYGRAACNIATYH